MEPPQIDVRRAVAENKPVMVSVLVYVRVLRSRGGFFIRRIVRPIRESMSV